MRARIKMNVGQNAGGRRRNQLKGAQLVSVRRFRLLRMMARCGMVGDGSVAVLKIACDETAAARIQREREQEDCALREPSPHYLIVHPLGLCVA